jgi:hypothetical protein
MVTRGEGPLPSLRSFNDKVAKTFDGDRQAGYLWVKVTEVGSEEVVNLTWAKPTGDPHAPWEHLEMEDPEGTEAYPALLEERVDWFGPILRLVWLSDEEAAADRDEQQFDDPWNVSAGGSGLNSLWGDIKNKFRRSTHKD